MYIESVKNMLPEERVEHLRKIQSAYSKCKEYSDDKVQLAMQTYEMVSHELWKNGHPLEWCMWQCFTVLAFPQFFLVFGLKFLTKTKLSSLCFSLLPSPESFLLWHQVSLLLKN